MALKLFLTGFFAVAACIAQNWEVSAGAGYGIYKNGTISGTTGTAEAGVRNRYVITGVVNEDLFEHFSGEVRYVYHAGDTFLQSGSAQGSIPAYSHTITYDLLFHFRPRASRLRPYVAAGAGGKYYGVSGTVPRPQPVPAIAGLTTQSQWVAVFDFGAGVKYKVTDHFAVSGAFRDYISLFPSKLFTPANGAKESSVLHQFTPMFGVGYVF